MKRERKGVKRKGKGWEKRGKGIELGAILGRGMWRRKGKG